MNTTCCIVGGGPAGMMLGLLLARAGIDVCVLEKHADFFRDFRGDTIHPSTLQLIYELGLLDEFLARPHQKATQLNGFVEEQKITVADFSQLPVHCKYLAIMPQWDFLDFLASHAKKYPNFHLHMQTEATDLITDDGVVKGVKAKSPNGALEVYCKLVIGADGRSSIVRQCAGLKVEDIGAPMDVFWFRLTRKLSDPNEMFGKFCAGKIMVMINRQDYWQCGYVITKGQADIIRAQDITVFKNKIVQAIPFLNEQIQEIKSWDDVKLLTVKVDRLKQWYLPGLLCIGDAAHAMSPIGGVGINLAIQDAVATANILSTPLKTGTLTIHDLAQVQKRRSMPTKIIQKLQVLMQNRVVKAVLKKQQALELPWLASKLQNTQFFKNVVGYLIGIGVHPEHIRKD